MIKSKSFIDQMCQHDLMLLQLGNKEWYIAMVMIRLALHLGSSRELPSFTCGLSPQKSNIEKIH